MNFYKIPRFSVLFLIVAAELLLNSCKKFLDQKPKISQVVPQSPNDLQRLLDNTSVMNQQSAAGYAEFVADNYYLTAATWQALSTAGLNQTHIWASNPGPGLQDQYWFRVYTGPIYYANVVLDALPKITYEPKDSNLVRSIKGSALFYRAFHFYNLAQIFCRPYDQQYLSSPGIVLRLTSDASIIDHERATVGETYNEIIAELKEAANLLPITTSFPTRPSQTAAFAALARVYLSMRDYSNSAIYANMALQQKATLLDYNSRPVRIPPFTVFNPEVIFHDVALNSNTLLNPGQAWIDTTVLYKSYDINDLRKVLFFSRSGAQYYFIGSYNNVYYTVFDGLATDELYFIRSECSARAGNKDSALADLNRVLNKRWKNTVLYTNITATDATDALHKILFERRKELVFRGQWWTDIRRLNLEGANITLQRNIGGTLYTLPPNDLRTVMLIPADEIAKSGIQQNAR